MEHGKSVWILLPEASFGLRVLSSPASVCVCPCVCVSLWVNHLLVHAITRDPFKLGSPNLDQRCKRPWLRSLLFLGWLTLTFKVKFNFKVKIYPILSLWVCPRHKSPPFEVRISIFGPKMHLSTVKVPIDFGIDWPWSSVSFLISNLFLLANFASLIHFASVCIYLVRPSPVNAPHSTWHRI